MIAGPDLNRASTHVVAHRPTRRPQAPESSDGFAALIRTTDRDA